MKTARTRTIQGLRLKLTCPSHPEQYDVYLGDEQVAYFRLRHGIFRIDIPKCGDLTIYRTFPRGRGEFEPEERESCLTRAVQLVLNYRKDQRLTLIEYKYEWQGIGLLITTPSGTCFLQGEEGTELYDQLESCEHETQIETILSMYEDVCE